MLPSQSEPKSVPFLPRFLATGFFSGYSPLFPGTAGSLVGLALYAIPGAGSPLTYSLCTAAAFFLGTIASDRMERSLGEDPQVVVIDEIVGMWVSLMFLPRSLVIAAAAFVFFRVYDTIKPSPARQAERLKHGWGIMLDDVVAAIYANLTVRVLLLIPALQSIGLGP